MITLDRIWQIIKREKSYDIDCTIKSSDIEDLKTGDKLMIENVFSRNGYITSITMRKIREVKNYGN